MVGIPALLLSQVGPFMGGSVPEFLTYWSKIRGTSFVANVNAIKAVSPWCPSDHKSSKIAFDQSLCSVENDFVKGHVATIGDSTVSIPAIDVFLPKILSINQIGYMQEFIDKNWQPQYEQHYAQKSDTLNFKGDLVLSALNNLGFKKPVVYPIGFDAEKFYANVQNVRAKDFLDSVGESCFLQLKETDTAYTFSLNLARYKAAMIKSLEFYQYTNTTLLGKHMNFKWKLFNSMNQDALDKAILDNRTTFILDEKSELMPMARSILAYNLDQKEWGYYKTIKPNCRVQVLITYLGGVGICFEDVNGNFIGM